MVAGFRSPPRDSSSARATGCQVRAKIRSRSRRKTDSSIYALAGNVKARARSSPALTDRSCVTDTRRSLRPRCRHRPTVGCGSLLGPAIVYRMTPTDGPEDDRNHEHDRGRAENRELVLPPWDVDTANLNRPRHAVREQVRPKREDGRPDDIGLTEEHGDPGTYHAAADFVRPSDVR